MFVNNVMSTITVANVFNKNKFVNKIKTKLK